MAWRAGMQRLAPVAGQALAEGSGLADVHDAAVSVAEEVGARRVGDARRVRSGDAHPAILGWDRDASRNDVRYLTVSVPVIVVGWTSHW